MDLRFTPTKKSQLQAISILEKDKKHFTSLYHQENISCFKISSDDEWDELHTKQQNDYKVGTRKSFHKQHVNERADLRKLISLKRKMLNFEHSEQIKGIKQQFSQYRCMIEDAAKQKAADNKIQRVRDSIFVLYTVLNSLNLSSLSLTPRTRKYFARTIGLGFGDLPKLRTGYKSMMAIIAESTGGKTTDEHFYSMQLAGEYAIRWKERCDDIPFESFIELCDAVRQVHITTPDENIQLRQLQNHANFDSPGQCYKEAGIQLVQVDYNGPIKHIKNIDTGFLIKDDEIPHGFTMQHETENTTQFDLSVLYTPLVPGDTRLNFAFSKNVGLSIEVWCCDFDVTVVSKHRILYNHYSDNMIYKIGLDTARSIIRKIETMDD